MREYTAKVRPEKVEQVGEIRERMERASVVLLTEYRGLTVSQLARLRRELAKANVEYKVVKNTLARLAARELGVDVDRVLEGPTAIAFCFGDPVAAAKAMTTFAREHQALVLKGGMLDRRPIDADGAKGLASVDPREVSLAKVVGLLQAPLASIAGTLQAPLSRIAFVLQQVAERGDAAA